MAARSSAPVLGALCSSSNPESSSLTSSSEGGKWYSAHHWEISAGWRHQYSHRHFVGTVEQTQRDKQGTEVVNSINLIDLGVTYQVNPRWSLSLSVPILNATRTYDAALFQTLLHVPGAPDQTSHSNGIGDIGISAQFWAVRPPAEKGHNVAFSFGWVIPTGNYAAKSTVNTVSGPMTVYDDQSIQPGQGGYGITFGTQAFQRYKRSLLYISGTYMVTPQEMSSTPNASLAGVKLTPNPLTSKMSIPDQYLLDGGVAYPFPKIRGLAWKTGMRYEGVKVKDLLGGSLGFRRPGYALSVEPGFQYERKGYIWTFNLPVAVQRNRKRSVPDLLQGRAGDAAFADYMLLYGFSKRF